MTAPEQQETIPHPPRVALMTGCGGDDLECGFRERAKEIPVGRFGRPEDVPSMIAYLASDEAAFVTGQAIGVDGGW